MDDFWQRQKDIYRWGRGSDRSEPILHPGESFEYSSGVGISGFAGAMKGIYFFEKIDDQTKFTAEIPLFQLTTDFSLNWKLK